MNYVIGTIFVACIVILALAYRYFLRAKKWRQDAERCQREAIAMLQEAKATYARSYSNRPSEIETRQSSRSDT